MMQVTKAAFQVKPTLFQVADPLSHTSVRSYNIQSFERRHLQNPMVDPFPFWIRILIDFYPKLVYYVSKFILYIFLEGLFES
ncbi:MAG: hypothetical protein A3F18_06785 [Legionellales bacterium RIFCSPHIGHO2_12_FULL_37_14]|nr:MAG: hypothetical protein A3F18_06785 [Legionellales bacterium RIFCSPHIGHO2_12_FULL_37_14]